MVCANCGQENPATAGFCFRCGQALGVVAPAPITSPAPKPQGTRRNVGLLPLWLILTANLYWLFWLHKTYKETRAHTPSATEITPGKAVGFLFIPLFNIYWFFRVVIDLPRAIRRMQEDDPLGEPLLNPGLVSGLLIAGMLGNAVLGRFHLAFLILGEPLLIAGFIVAQISLNAHWERHAARAVPGARIATPAAAPSERSLAALLGVRTPEIDWSASAAFLVASVAADLVFLLFAPLVQGDRPLPLPSWGLSFAADLLFAAAAVGFFRWIRSDAGAAALAATAYTALQTPMRVLVLSSLYPEYHWDPASLLFSLAANFLFLLFLALAIRMIQPLWLGLWLGASAAQLAATLVYQIGSYLQARMREAYQPSFYIHWQDVATDLAFAAVFAFAFWGGLALFAPKVLRSV